MPHRSDRPISLKASVPLLLAAVFAAWLGVSASSAAEQHRSGAWFYPPQIARALAYRGYASPACSGRGAFRWTWRSSPNDHQTWLYRHFECFSGYPPTMTFFCVHSLKSGGIYISRIIDANAYRPCRF